MTVQTFANGDTNYVSKLNSNFAGLDASITTLLSQVGALVNNPNSTLPLMNALFGQSMALIDTGSYATTGNSSTLSVAAGYAWLPTASAVVQKLTNTDFSFSGLSAGTYYVHIGADGTVTYNTTSTGGIYSVVWTGSAFGAITLLVPITQFEDIKHKAQASGYASLDSGSHVPVAQLPILGVVQNANKVLAGPTTGADALPAMRALVAADIPAMVGDTGSGGTKGAAPAPASGDAAANKYLKADGSWATVSGATGGTVTTASVVSANGFSGTVATASSTPAITLATSISGILKGSSGALAAAAVADYPVMVGSGTNHAPGFVPDPGASAGSTKFLREDGSWDVPPGTGPGGTVTSVGLSLPNIFTVTNSPVTGSATLTGTLAVQNANKVWAGPTTGADATPTFRSLVAGDIPDISGTYVPNTRTVNQ